MDKGEQADISRYINLAARAGLTAEANALRGLLDMSDRMGATEASLQAGRDAVQMDVSFLLHKLARIQQLIDAEEGGERREGVGGGEEERIIAQTREIITSALGAVGTPTGD